MARLFAVVLLAWTTTDLAGHGVCCHDREPIAAGLPFGSGAATTAERPGVPSGTTECNGPDDCFCCCRCVDVQVRFVLAIASSFISEVVTPQAGAPQPTPSSLYHPPLA